MVLNVNTVPTQISQTNKNESPSSTRMAVRYGIALPLAYDLYEAGKTFVEAKKAGKTYSEVAMGKFLKNAEKATNSVKSTGKLGIAEMISKLIFNKTTLILAGVGVGVGLAMKKLSEKYPDNKIIKAANATAQLISF